MCSDEIKPIGNGLTNKARLFFDSLNGDIDAICSEYGVPKERMSNYDSVAFYHSLQIRQEIESWEYWGIKIV